MCVKRVKQHVESSPLEAHDAGSSSKPKRIVNQADILVAAFVKDPHIQGTCYATLIAIVSLYSIFHTYILS